MCCKTVQCSPAVCYHLGNVDCDHAVDVGYVAVHVMTVATADDFSDRHAGPSSELSRVWRQVDWLSRGTVPHGITITHSDWVHCNTVEKGHELYSHNHAGLVAWHSGRTLVFDRQSFPVLRSTCSWWVTTYVGKLSAVGQPTRPTQPFILPGR